MDFNKVIKLMVVVLFVLSIVVDAQQPVPESPNKHQYKNPFCKKIKDAMCNDLTKDAKTWPNAMKNAIDGIASLAIAGGVAVTQIKLPENVSKENKLAIIQQCKDSYKSMLSNIEKSGELLENGADHKTMSMTHDKIDLDQCSLAFREKDVPENPTMSRFVQLVDRARSILGQLLEADPNNKAAPGAVDLQQQQHMPEYYPKKDVPKNPFCEKIPDTMCTDLTKDAKTWPSAMKNALDSVAEIAIVGSIALNQTKVPENVPKEDQLSIEKTCMESYTNLLFNIYNAGKLLENGADHKKMEMAHNKINITDCEFAFREKGIPLPEPINKFEQVIDRMSSLLNQLLGADPNYNKAAAGN